MLRLIKNAFPLKPVCIFYGLAQALAFHLVVVYPVALSSYERALLLMAPILLLSSERQRRKNFLPYFTWLALWLLVGAIPYDWIVPEAMQASYFSSLRLSLGALALLAFALWRVSLQSDEAFREESREEWAKRMAEEAWEELQKAEEERIREIAEENARHRQW